MNKAWELLTLCVIFLTCADGTHFRGAMFWWTASKDDPRQVDISFRVAWRRTYREFTFCDLTTIASKTLIGPPDAGQILCLSGCYRNDLPVGDMSFYCTDYSEIEDWSSGERTYPYTFPGPQEYRLGWKGKGWVEGLTQGTDAPWAFSMYLDLRPRADTGRMNSSPRTGMTTIISLKQGCNHTITIPREDPDGDDVFCRWADPMLGECGGICAHNPGIQLNPVRCELRFPSTASLGWYALAIQLEDYIRDTQMPMASVPLQFLAHVYQSGAACDALPVFISPTPEDGTCLLPVIGQTNWFLIVAQTKDIATTITDVTSTSTDGMQKSAVRHKPDTREYYVNVTWTPTERREHIYCFVAVDSAKVSTPQRCIYLAVDPVRPRALYTSLSEDKRTIFVTFNQEIYLPFTSHYVWVYNRVLKTLLFMEDTAISPRVDKVNRTLHIQLPSYINFIDDVYLILQAGAVRGKARCAQSEAVDDPSLLVVRTGVVPTGVVPTVLPTQSSNSPVSGHTGSEQTTSGSGSSLSTECCPEVSPAAQQDINSRDYTWLIVLLIGTVLLIAAAILVAVFIKKGPPKFTKSPAAAGGAAGAGAAGAGVAGAGAAGPSTLHRNPRRIDFSDIDVKFR